MNKELLRHIEILKTVPEIKESIEELKFGCVIKWDLWYLKYLWEFTDFSDYGNWELLHKFLRESWWTFECNHLPKTAEIIWQISERYLRMFCKENQISFNYWHNCLRLWIVWSWINTPRYSDSKPYMEQSEEFFKKLNDWICKEFSIDIN